MWRSGHERAHDNPVLNSDQKRVAKIERRPV
jgi:hypothetical protein